MHMRAARTWTRTLFLAAFGFLLSASDMEPAFAAWPQPRGELLTITTLTAYQADTRFNATGQPAETGDFRKQELSLYAAYGLSEKLTLGAQPNLVRVQARPLAGARKRSRTGLSNIELFARYALRTGEGWIVSAQALTKLPGPTATEREPLLESDNRDIETRLLFGQSGLVWGREYFRSVEAGYRFRSAGASDQIRVDITAGFRPWPRWQIIGQSFNIVSTRRGNGSDPTEFDLYKAQLSLLRDLTPRAALQVGGYTEYAGRNIGAGDALLASVWLRF